MVYLPIQSYTCTIKINHSCGQIYQSHGSYRWDFSLPPICQHFEVTGVAGSERPVGKCSHGHLNDC